jgi:hypothetical protein
MRSLDNAGLILSSNHRSANLFKFYLLITILIIRSHDESLCMLFANEYEGVDKK